MKKMVCCLVLFGLLFFECPIVFGIPKETASRSAQIKKSPDLPLASSFIPTGAAPIVQRKFVDVRDLLQRLSRLGNFSMMVDGEVRGNLEKVEGVTYEEILEKNLKPLGFEWRFWQGCLYVGSPEKLAYLWESINKPFIPNATLGKKMSLDMRNVELETILSIIKNYSGIGIQATGDLSMNMSIRIIEMPWEQVLWGIVHMNGLRVIPTDFSITITP